jgi:signal transduction histidine kinase
VCSAFQTLFGRFFDVLPAQPQRFTKNRENWKIYHQSSKNSIQDEDQPEKLALQHRETELPNAVQRALDACIFQETAIRYDRKYHY